MTSTDLYGTFTRDPLGVLLQAIEYAGRPVTSDEVAALLVRSGLPDYAVTAQWTHHERAIKDDPHVTYIPETRTFAWGAAVPLPDPTEAAQRLASGKAQINPDRKVLGDIVLAALALGKSPLERPHFEKPGRSTVDSAGECARAFAKVAMELEELIASGASARALLQRIRAGAQAHGLRPIESAGATIRFDRLRHDPVGPSTPEGSEVLVLRPGYVWQAGGEEVLVAKAVVIEQ